MKILHVIASFNPTIGGPADAIRNIILEHKKSGVDAEVVCLDKQDTLEFSDDLDKFDIHLLNHIDNFWFYSPTLRNWLKQNIDRFDIVIMHGLWLYPSYAINRCIQWLKSSRQTDKISVRKIPKFFIFPHGMLDPYFQNASGRKFKAFRNLLYWKFIENKVASGADALLFTCETELVLAQDTFSPYRPKREINIGLGISAPPLFTEFMQSEFYLRCPELVDKPYVLFLGRINYKKGVDLLIKAYAAIANEQDQISYKLPKLVIAGPGMNSSFGNTIKQLVAENHSIRDAVYFPGMLTGDAKWGAIYGCDSFLLPSHQENFGIAVAEALACGKPVLISNQVNIWREILQENAGIINQDTVEGTKKSLTQWLCLSSHDKREMEQKALYTFEHYFQMSQVVNRLNKVFDML